ncbi:MAG: DUF2231 domain-containing protein [Chloroflexota bacterium]
MESKAKFAGHAIHPMLIVFPLGLLVTSLVFDILYFLTGNVGFATAAYWSIAAGIVGGLLAAVFGLWDWLAIPSGTRARTIGLWHGAGNAVVLVLFAVSWLFRFYDLMHLPTVAAFVVSLLGVIIGSVTGWLGGELVERLGVGVDPGAHLNAPSSLFGRPAAVQGARAADARGAPRGARRQTQRAAQEAPRPPRGQRPQRRRVA